MKGQLSEPILHLTTSCSPYCHTDSLTNVYDARMYGAKVCGSKVRSEESSLREVFSHIDITSTSLRWLVLRCTAVKLSIESNITGTS